jgi:DNA polymerase-3 subunit beta
MELKIKKSDLLDIIGKTQNIVEKRNTMPILVNVLIEAIKNPKGDTLKVYATDLEVSLTDEAPCKVTTAGKVAVDAKQLFQIVKELNEDGVIQLKSKDNNWLIIQQGKAVFNVVGKNPEEYPMFPTYTSDIFVKIKSQTLKEMIEKTIYSVSTDETRYHLNGVFFEQIKNGNSFQYRMVATDGHRLSLVDRETGFVAEGNVKFEKGVIIPRKGLAEISKILETSMEDVEFTVEGPQLILKNNSAVLMIRLIEGKYPNFLQLIPKSLSRHIVASRHELIQCLKRVSLLSNKKSKGITVTLSHGVMSITTNNPELGDAKEEIQVNYDGEEIKIGFNARYLLDILNSFNEDEVEIELNDQLSPGLFRPKQDNKYTCIVMPMRI